MSRRAFAVILLSSATQVGRCQVPKSVEQASQGKRAKIVKRILDKKDACDADPETVPKTQRNRKAVARDYNK
jgi:hypothetical protein